MPIDRGPWNALVDDDGSNLVGTVWNKDKIKTVILDPTDAVFATMGVWSTVPFLASNFPSQAGITAGQVTVNRYTVIGKTLLWHLQISGGPGSGTAQLLLNVPGGVPIASAMAPLSSASDAGAYTPGFVGYATSTQTYVQKSTSTVWAGPVYVFFMAIIAQA